MDKQKQINSFPKRTRDMITKSRAQIMELASKIDMETQFACMVRHYGHCQNFSVSIVHSKEKFQDDLFEAEIFTHYNSWESEEEAHERIADEYFAIYLAMKEFFDADVVDIYSVDLELDSGIMFHKRTNNKEEMDAYLKKVKEKTGNDISKHVKVEGCIKRNEKLEEAIKNAGKVAQ